MQLLEIRINFGRIMDNLSVANMSILIRFKYLSKQFLYILKNFLRKNQKSDQDTNHPTTQTSNRSWSFFSAIIKSGVPFAKKNCSQTCTDLDRATFKRCHMATLTLHGAWIWGFRKKKKLEKIEAKLFSSSSS